MKRREKGGIIAPTQTALSLCIIGYSITEIAVLRDVVTTIKIQNQIGNVKYQCCNNQQFRLFFSILVRE